MGPVPLGIAPVARRLHVTPLLTLGRTNSKGATPGGAFHSQSRLSDGHFQVSWTPARPATTLSDL
jgi:hypothetical protein